MLMSPQLHLTHVSQATPHPTTCSADKREINLVLYLSSLLSWHLFRQSSVLRADTEHNWWKLA